jgi:uncharacterized membrane protein
MAVQLYDAPPAVAPVPLRLFELAIGADLLGRVTGSTKLQATARCLMPVVALTAAASSLPAPEAASHGRAEGARRRAGAAAPRTTALSLVGAAAVLASWRWRRPRASAAYLALGIVAIGLMASATLDGEEDPLRLRATHGPEAPPGPIIEREPSSPRVAAAVRTEAGDRLRGL